MKQARDGGAAYIVILSHKLFTHIFYSPGEGLAIVLLLLFICYRSSDPRPRCEQKGLRLHCLSLHGQVARPAGTKGSGGFAGSIHFYCPLAGPSPCASVSFIGKVVSVRAHAQRPETIVTALVAAAYSHEPGVEVHYARAAARNYCFTYKT